MNLPTHQAPPHLSRGRPWMKWLAVAVAAVVVLLTLAVAWKYHAVSRQSWTLPELIVQLEPSRDVVLGQPVAATICLLLPWHVRPRAATLTPGDGTQGVGRPAISRERFGWGRSTWRVTAIIQPYRDGETGPGNLAFQLVPPAPKASPGTMSVVIPNFPVAPADTADLADPQLAGRLFPDWRDHLRRLLELPWHLLAILGLAVILLAGGLAVMVWRLLRRRLLPTPPPPPWTTALARLGALRTELTAGSVPAETALQRLSDIVRNYLEARFELHAPRQTTIEFLRDMERADSPLSPPDRTFLKDFLTAADLIKFARQPADLAAITEALSRAETLVRKSIPDTDQTPGGD